MRAFALVALAAMTLLPLGTALAQTDASTVLLVPDARVRADFAKGVPIVETDDYKVHASRREGPGMAEIHTRDTDIAYVLKGSATLVTGGTALDTHPIGPEEIRGSGIQGGETRRLVPGDVVVIPNGIPHWFKEVEAPFLYYVVKVREAARPLASEAAR
jgi:glc operon protein GlcG